MLYTNNRLIKLEQKVDELERNVDRKPTQRDTIEEVQSRLENYENDVKFKNGRMKIGDNLIIRNRKAKKGGKHVLNPSLDNVFTIAFNNADDSRLNHIFLGTESREGNENCSVIRLSSRKKYNVDPSLNNGNIQLTLVKDKDIEDGVLDEDMWELPQFGVTTLDNALSGNPNYTDEELEDLRNDDNVQVIANGTSGEITIGIYEDNGSAFDGVTFTKDTIYPFPATDADGNQIPNSGYDLGESDNKFDTIHAVNTNFGDVTFQNDWKITEAWKVGIEKDGLAILDDEDNLIMFIGKEGISFEENYVKTNRDQRDMLTDEEYKRYIKKKPRKTNLVKGIIN